MEIPLRQQTEIVGVGQRRRGHLEQRIGQRSVELAHRPGSRLLPGRVEELAPLNLQPGQQLAVPVQVVVGGRVLEQRHARDRAQERAGAVENIPDGVAGPGHAVAEAVRGHSELDRDEGAPSWVRRLVVLEGDLRGPGRHFLVHRVGHGLPHDGGQELVGHDPLVVPPGQAPSRLEHGRPRRSACAQSVHQPVVELLHGHVELEDDLRLVVAGVGDDGSALGAAVGVVGRNAGHVIDDVWLHVPSLCFVHAVRPLELACDLVVGTLNDQELVPVVGVVELRVRVGAQPIDGVEVVAGRAEVGGRVGVGLLIIELRGVEGDVVVDELANEGEP